MKFPQNCYSYLLNSDEFCFQVSENDLLPKFLCLDCWIKLDYFHEFYNAVAEAKTNFFGNSVKIEEPTFIEVNCNADVDFEAERIEPIIEPQPLIDNNRTFETYASPSDNDCNGNFAGNDDYFNDNDDDDVDGNSAEKMLNNKIDSNENGKSTERTIKRESIVEQTLDSNALAELAKTILGIYNATISRTDKRNANKKFMQMTPKYFDMICELCDYKFQSFHQAYTHYRQKHYTSTVNVKCCRQSIQSKDIRDHILHHLYPEIFK